jgi:hypothetical protein
MNWAGIIFVAFVILVGAGGAYIVYRIETLRGY